MSLETKDLNEMTEHHSENNRPNPQEVDFDRAPFVAIWEVTRACGLACRHCRAEAISDPLPGQLSALEGFDLLDQLAEMGTPICVLSGGDPARRPDLVDLVAHGSQLGMRMATIPAGTDLLTRELLMDLQRAGLAQVAFSLDGPTAGIHDNFRQTPGAFRKTLRGALWAREVGIPLQINTTFSAYNWEHFEAVAQLVRDLGVVFWEVFFLVPMGRGRNLKQLNSLQYEAMFMKLAAFAESVEFIVKVTEGPHYRRYLIQNRSARSARRRQPNGKPSRTPHLGRRAITSLSSKGVNSGKGHLFVSHDGDIFPSGFLPYTCGNVRRDRLARVYRQHPVFRELRDVDRLKGKCGVCEFRSICGGSRARAYAMTGDWLAEEPFCLYQPGSGKTRGHSQEMETLS